jgi:hypothetical protein
MTAQIEDILVYKRKKYAIVGVEGDGLFTPERYGMRPRMIHTACQRGFYLVYRLVKNRLTLQELTLREQNQRYLPINGVEAVMRESNGHYRGLDVRVPFSGTLRIARDFIQEHYVHMGFQKPSAYKTVLDLTFNLGELEKADDISSRMNRKAGAFKQRYESGDVVERIDEAFSLDLGND